MKAKLYPVSSETDVSEAITAAREALNSHETIVIPTDTVYGIACDAFSHEGVAKLLSDKGRSRTMPPPVMIFDQASLSGVADEIPDEVYELGRKFWPGALTVILYSYPSLNWDLGDTQGTVAVRVPNDEFALKLLTEHGPLAVSSANKTGQQAAVNAQQAADQLGENVSLIVDAGDRPASAGSTKESTAASDSTSQAPDTDVPGSEDTETADSGAESAPAAETTKDTPSETAEGTGSDDAPAQALPSTILDCTCTPFVVVREGAISVEALREVVPSIVTRAELDERNELKAKERAAEGETHAAAGQEDLDEAYEQWDKEHSQSSESARRAGAPAEGSIASALMGAVGVLGEVSASAGIDQQRTRQYRNNTPKPVKRDEAQAQPFSAQQARALVFGEQTEKTESASTD